MEIMGNYNRQLVTSFH